MSLPSRWWVPGSGRNLVPTAPRGNPRPAARFRLPGVARRRSRSCGLMRRCARPGSVRHAWWTPTATLPGRSAVGPRTSPDHRVTSRPVEADADSVACGSGRLLCGARTRSPQPRRSRVVARDGRIGGRAAGSCQKGYSVFAEVDDLRCSSLCLSG